MVTNNAINGNTIQYLKVASNLSDVNNVNTSRNNLGLGVADTPTFRALDVRNASNNFVDFTVPSSALTDQTYVMPPYPPGLDGYGLGCTTTGASFWTSAPDKMTLVASATASNSANIVFTGLSSTPYAYRLIFQYNVNNNINNSCILNFSTNNGSTWDTGANYLYSTLWFNGSPTASVAGTNSGNSFIMNSGEVLGTTTGQLQYHDILLYNIGQTAVRVLVCSAESGDNGFFPSSNRFNGFYNTAAGGSVAVNALRLQFSIGNIPSGTFKLYAYGA